ncbi:MAG: hypothetical protein ACK5IC_05990 [Moheibacter sp.]
MEYENSHTYTFKVRRSVPQYYIESIVLHFNPDTDQYNEYMIQYDVTEEQYLNIVNGLQLTEDLPVMVRQFENGTFSGLLENSRGRLICGTSCSTVNVNCAENIHSPGQEGCVYAGTDGAAYSYTSCTTTCVQPTYMDPGEGGPGLDNGNGMCVIPWVANLNYPVALNINEHRILNKYLYIFEQYFNGMSNNADYGVIRSLINYLIINDNASGEEFAYDIVYSALDGTLLTTVPFFKFPNSSNYSTLYPQFTFLVKDHIPTLKNNQELIQTINNLTGVSINDIKNDLTWGEGPEIHITQLGSNVKGKFNILEPDRIYIDIDLVQLLENIANIDNPTPEQEHQIHMLNGLVIYAVCLYEYVHYNDFVFDGEMSDTEELELGLLFEEIFVGGYFEFDPNGNVILISPTDD